VTAFNGRRYRQRPIADVVQELQSVPEKRVLLVDDNLIGTSAEHLARAKDLFRAMIKAKVGKQWIAQATINIADDDELLMLAGKAGCLGVFVGFESPTPEGLREVGKKLNLLRGRDLRAAVRHIQRHRISVVGSFIIGLDVDKPGIGRQIADVAGRYGVDHLNVLFLTPLPGTRLWERMASEGRIALDTFPEDWRHYTLTFPVARYAHFSLDGVTGEMLSCNRDFYSARHIAGRVWRSMWRWRNPLITLVGNLSYRGNLRLDSKAYAEFRRVHGDKYGTGEAAPST
jgi:radical SAM superfamily enzyme YgiQ (UPF0313 family)